MFSSFKGRRLSVTRSLLLVVVLGGLAMSAFVGWNWFRDTQTAAQTSWFGGYVDVTATPAYRIEDPPSAAAETVVLSFIVAHPDNPCRPSWGGYYTLEEANTELDLDRRAARLAETGGEIIVSFGGLLNDELATACTDTAQLVRAYGSVIDRYQISTIDLDIEADDLGNTEAGKRRAEAIAALQQERSAQDPLRVWLTLPVAPTGLTEQGTAAVSHMLDAGVDLAGVNIMTMDYGGSRMPDQTMLDASIDAANSTHRQLGILYDQAGQHLGTKTLWKKIGLTPMIGQNDVPEEVFDLEAARGLNRFAHDNGVGRISMWSLNRDSTCGENWPDLKRVSDSCSGIDQGAETFAEVLGAGYSGRADGPADAVESAEPATTPAVIVDDPATSPYPVWTEEYSYLGGDKVVWHGHVYEAKWWTQGDLPDNPVLQAAETPWTLIGPVLPGETPAPVLTAPPGTYPEWDGEATYLKAARVMYEGRVFEAKWWTKGDSPEAALAGSNGSPWLKLSDDKLREIIRDASTEPPADPRS
ncbi:chitinase [Arthrobacter mobilis]|uniref:Glycosyl hydrolase family 18 n=1 Tax=Arthrobacter mobilis TaxID=2724944 RepID=A0A7X6HDR6_9MICC|nr:chitinase [Arthrobacter mobilis]NKX54303.1 glycosyl hydrolase family 18 [Arthrobacter mobilis]